MRPLAYGGRDLKIKSMYEIEHYSNGKLFQTTLMGGQITRYSLLKDFYLTISYHTAGSIERFNISVKIVTSNKRKVIKEFSKENLLKLHTPDNILFAKYNSYNECNKTLKF